MIIYNGTYCVYAHINKINGKIYIGQTKHGNNPNRRWDNGRSYKHSAHFYSAILKYGWDDGFYHEVIANNLTLEEANKFEMLLIEKLETTNPSKGYNIESGGKNSRMSAETRLKISVANKGRKLSPETIAKIRESHKNYHPTEETRRKMGNAQKGVKNWNAKPVNQYDLKTGELIRQWDYICQVKEELGYSDSDISACCSEKNKSANGFLWTYADVSDEYVRERVELKKIHKNPHSKIVCQYSKDGVFIREWENCAIPQRELGVSNIRTCCEGKYKQAGGFIWLYKDDVTEELLKQRVKDANAPILRSNLRKINQYTKEGDFVQTWNSISEAAKYVGSSTQNIYECCCNARRSVKGFIWAYFETPHFEIESRVKKLKENTHKPPLRTKSVCCYTLDGEFIKEYESIAAASRDLNIHNGHIGSCCKGNRKSAGGYKWKYLSEVT